MRKFVFFFCILIARCLKCTYTLCAYILQWCYCRFTISPSNVLVFLLDDGRFLLFIGTFFDRHNIFFYSPYPAWKRVRTGQTLAQAGVKNEKRKKWSYTRWGCWTSAESRLALHPRPAARSTTISRIIQNDMTHSVYTAHPNDKTFFLFFLSFFTALQIFFFHAFLYRPVFLPCCCSVRTFIEKSRPAFLHKKRPSRL